LRPPRGRKYSRVGGWRLSIWGPPEEKGREPSVARTDFKTKIFQDLKELGLGSHAVVQKKDREEREFAV